MAEVARDVGDDLVEYLTKARLTGHLPRVEVGACEQRVVVEHLLEVGHDPVRIDGVPRESSAEMVVDATGGHGIERVGHHVQRVVVTGLQV